ncbi:MAG: hypothetical protein ACXWU2_11535 [Allosphingosinicella sp.]
MNRSILLPACAAAAALLTACEARIGNDAAPVAENATAAGRAEEGRVTIEAPGFNMSIDIPEGLRSRAEMDSDNGLIYPGSTLSGIHVLGRPERADGSSEGEVELRFSTGNGADRVAAWYRDPARGEDFTVQSAARDGDAFVIQGTGRQDDERFSLRLTGQGTGTEGRLVLSDNHR